ncbi:hypothetical protein G6F62_009347 [Rhizopus arrhizus]|nr:hypothetical protein G6F22_012772 [Rhizopus arrhizus]KAG1221240.1 hypothetical protein G6F35_006131 [Rhizopus arrhizus]KAG1323998.1 hypothetical protein G6F62_009347 [Rhizopus arrhizus]
MIFSKVFKSNPIQTFEISIWSGNEGNSVAYGPGSIINGNVKLYLDKPVQAKYIKVIFTCEEKKESVTLFSVESNIWNSKQENGEELDIGTHLYLFAIQIPYNVNYPPTIKDDYLGHRIEYSVQGHIYLSDGMKRATNRLPLTYLPLVTFDTNPISTEKTVRIERGEEYVLVSAKLVNPYSCPGDVCRIKLETQNRSSHSIHQVSVQLISTTTSMKNNNTPIASTGPSYHHKRHEILSESHYVSIPKHTQNMSTTSICAIQIPNSCVPTTQSHFASKYIDITYEVVVFIPAMGSSINDTKHIATHPNSIRLPLVITTVPSSIPSIKIPYSAHNDTSDALPTFIPYIESPIPSPTMPIYQQWGPGSPVDPAENDEHVYPSSPIEDVSGHLMVPPSTSPARSLSVNNA